MSLELDGTHCVCNNVSFKEIIHLVDKHEDIKTIEDLQQYCHCADKCSYCESDVQKIIDHFKSIR